MPNDPSAFVQGQRWISSTEPELGLGIITQAEGRLIHIFFPAADEERAYAAHSAPLSRVVYRQGDEVRDADGRELQVADVHENRGVLIYLCFDADGGEHLLPEVRLNAVIQLSGPKERLFAGQIDRLSRYRLRYHSRLHAGLLQQSNVTGLIGPRVQLLPHQLYIAHEVGRRHQPRVLLADEVGLGKTIEAGMIVHQQLVSGRAKRVLIVVPDSLLHQWLVEMLRRFNLRFSILDEDRCAAIEMEAGDDEEAPNPFESAQCVLCAESWLTADPQRQAQAVAAGWDLLVVDEAHHLQWRPDEASPAYRCIEALADQVPGLLLLTATPEQSGAAGHFARLRLLDPQRFHDLAAFEQEEQRYHEVSDVLVALQAEDAWVKIQQDAGLRDRLNAYLGDDHLDQLLAEAEVQDGKTPAQLLDQLIHDILDRHGTGRVLFRNTRSGVEGFPGRALTVWPQDAQARPASDLDGALYPERDADADWPAQDARVEWLSRFLREHKQDKVLLICSQASTAIQLEDHLRLREGLMAAVFHEGLSLVERDRVAAWFADPDDGAQILLCSEIGSEGRNFQFARHLVLFDLPLDPDLLEQRIGRLDRIGQQGVVEIHIPYFEDSAQAGLMRWYRDGLSAFERPFGAGQQVLEQFGDRLQDVLVDGDEDALDALIKETRQFVEAELARLESGRDRLLELNSCKPGVADEVVDAVRQNERAGVLTQYLEQVFDEFGVEHESHSADALIARPGAHMHVPHFPGLPDDGMTGTFRRELAMSREDMQFLSWEHPLVSGAMEMILAGDFGNTALCTVKLGGIAPGTVMLEALFVLGAQAPKALQLDRYLPPEPVRLLRDNHGRDLSEALSAEQLNQLGERVPKHTAHALVKQAKPLLQALLEKLEAQAREIGDSLRLQALDAMKQERGLALDRLQALAAVNPSIRADEVAHFREETAALAKHLDQAGLQLDGLRVVIAT